MSPATIEIEVASCCNIVVYGRFHDYQMFRGRMMGNQEEQSLKEAKRVEKSAAEEAERLAREQERKKAYWAREKASEEARKEKETKRLEKRAAEEVKELAREQTRREAYLAREKATAEAQEARKRKAEKLSPK